MTPLQLDSVSCAWRPARRLSRTISRRLMAYPGTAGEEEVEKQRVMNFVQEEDEGKQYFARRPCAHN